MKSYYSLILITAGLILAGFLVFAQTDDPFADIVYPVPELGNCTDKGDCLDYCDDSDNMEPCLDFAEKHELMPQEDIDMARKMLKLGETSGPGGCRGQAECDAFCNDINNIEECITFAEKYNLMPADELAESKKVAAALKRGVQPPPCDSKSECDKVCTEPENMKVCIAFAKEAGLIPPEELAEVEKVLAALDKGITPPPCGGKDKCEEYCSQPENLEVCITFAEAAGFMSPEEAAMVRKTGGKGPGNCRGKDECEAYCENPDNMGPCIDFAIEHGFMSPEEAEQAKKMLAAGFTSGPGGCKGQQECEAYCEDFTHLEECVNFAEKAGFMTPEDAARARQMMESGINMMQGGPGGCKGEEECRSFCEDPANMEECMKFAIQIGEMTPEEAEGMRGKIEMMQRGGPGGCTSEEECMAYCEDPAHGIECINFSVEIGQMSPEEAEEMLEMMQGGGMMQPGGEGGEMMEFEEREGGMMPEGMMPEGMQEEFMEEMMPQGEIPEGMREQIEGQIQQQMEQQIQQQMQQQIEQQMEQMMPAPTSPEAPQSFFERVKNFLANLVPAI